MRCKVSILRKKGIVIPREKPIGVYEGDLSLSDIMHPVLGRLVSEAMLFGDEKRLLIPSLIDARVTSISQYGFHLRGFEYNSTTKGVSEYAQDWYCRPA